MKLLLDENLPPSFAVSLNALVKGNGHSVAHVRDLVVPGTPDVDWIPIAAGLEDAAVVSGDRKMLSRKHELKALKDAKLTTFILAPGWSHLPFWEKAWMLTRWWPGIIEAAAVHGAGSIFVVPHRQVPKQLKAF